MDRTDSTRTDQALEELLKASRQFEEYVKITTISAAHLVIDEPKPQQPDRSHPMGLVITGDR